MPKVSSFQNRTVPTQINIEGETINLRVRPYAITPEMEIAANNALDMFVAFVAEWDVTDDDGTPWPLDVESLKVFPSYLLVQIINEGRKATIALGK